ncbi:TPA: deoxyribonuclease V [Candidatus Poribacteria bacterium]|nr:deoxyribonuclease V [Candidatus Poribacteria bacterium]HEX30761.1 deoxyribonuclease V [Candidatus Poribacteria bacterium]
MHVKQIHPWNVSPREAMRIQNRLKTQVIGRDEFDPKSIRTVAGVDIGFRRDVAEAAIVVLEFPSMEIIDYLVEEKEVSFPYIPGLLSFRETPPLIAAFEKLKTEPDVIIVDGQGIAHPRRFGIASHLGLILDKPTVGCAKSRLYGRHREPGKKAGSIEYLYDRDEIIGAAVRTRDNVKYVYVSIGHKVSLDTAIKLVLECCRGYRLPEPTRQAHLIAGGARPPKKGAPGGTDQLTLW